MATIDRSTLKEWFRRGAKPLEAHFHNWIDSFWHHSDSIPKTSVEGLPQLIQSVDSLQNDFADLKTQTQWLLVNFTEANPLFVFLYNRDVKISVEQYDGSEVDILQYSYDNELWEPWLSGPKPLAAGGKLYVTASLVNDVTVSPVLFRIYLVL